MTSKRNVDIDTIFTTTTTTTIPTNDDDVDDQYLSMYLPPPKFPGGRMIYDLILYPRISLVKSGTDACQWGWSDVAWRVGQQ